MATEIAQLYASVGADTAKFDKGMSGVKKQIGVVGKSFGGLKTAVAGLGLAFGAVGAVQLGRMAVDMARAGADAATLEQSFDRLAMGVGESASSMLQAMRTASRGMVSDNDLILSANKAMLLGVADSGEELGQLLEVARVRGQAMGLTLTQAFNDIVTGIGRMSPMILDNLGIVTGGQKVFDDYAASIGKAGDALSDTEKKQALLGAVVASTADMIADSGSDATTAAEKFAMLDTSLANLNLTLGKLLAQPVANLAESFSIWATTVSLNLKDLENDISNSNIFSGLIEDSKALADADVLSRFEKSFERVTKRAQELSKQQPGTNEAEIAANKLSAALETLQDRQEAINLQFGQSEGINAFRENVNIVENALRQAQDTYLDSQRQIGRLTEELKAMSDKGFHPLSVDVKNAQGELEFYTQASAESERTSSALSGVLAQLGVVQADVTGETDMLSASFYRLGTAAIDTTDDVAALVQQMRTASHLGALDVTMGAIDVAGTAADWTVYDKASPILAFNLKLWQQQGIEGQELVDKHNDLVRTLQKSLAITDDTVDKTSRWGAATKKVSDAYDDIKSKVASILSGAIGPVAGVDAEDLLPREDAINENARRLADIAVNGLNPMAEWFDEFAMEAPETFKAITESADPQGTARILLKDFQDGLNPELIDKSLAASLVDRAFKADAATEQLIKDVAQEYADTYGVSLAEATEKAQEVLGGTADGGTITAPEIVTDTGAAMDTGNAAGVAYGQGWKDSVAALGASITTSLSTQLQAENNLTAIGNAGTTQGTKWGNEFLAVVGENVPAQLISILVDLVTPGVEANINTNAGLNGAAA